MSKRTELVFILDRSGSMAGLERDTIGGYNAMLERQQAVEGEARITTVLFDHEYEVLHDRIDIQAVSPITEQEYFVRGSTALLDAVGRTIHMISNAQRRLADPYRFNMGFPADQVLFVITTDGMENSSREYTYHAVRSLVEEHKQRHQWEFIFLGANIDAIEVAGRFGIAPSRAQNYRADRRGTALKYAVTSDAVASFRASGELDPDWAAELEDDYVGRGDDDDGEPEGR